MSSIRASWEFLLVLPEALWCGSSSCSDSRTAGSLRGTDADGTANVAAEQPIRPGMGRTISADAEALMRAPFALSDAGELSRLLERADFTTARYAPRDRCDGSHTGLRKACERGRACPRPPHRAGLAALPDRGASRALPRVIARHDLAAFDTPTQAKARMPRPAAVLSDEAFRRGDARRSGRVARGRGVRR